MRPHSVNISKDGWKITRWADISLSLSAVEMSPYFRIFFPRKPGLGFTLISGYFQFFHFLSSTFILCAALTAHSVRIAREGGK